MGLKGGSGAMRGIDGYDHIGMIDASGGLLDQDYEMFEQQTPHTCWSSTSTCPTRRARASGAAGSAWRRSSGSAPTTRSS